MMQRAGKTLGKGWHADAVERARRADMRGETGLSAQAARLLIWAYGLGLWRYTILKLIRRLDGGMIFSGNRRRVLSRYHGVEIGKYSYGDILRPGVLPRSTRVGAYCSVGNAIRVIRRDHPVDRPFLHAAFYNAAVGLVARDTITTDAENPLTIGHDVWIGDRVTILGGCREIGNGAVIGAGAIVTRDVAPYAIVAGVPAREVRRRFDADKIAALEASAWWERDLAELIGDETLPDPFEPFQDPALAPDTETAHGTETDVSPEPSQSR